MFNKNKNSVVVTLLAVIIGLLIAGMIVFVVFQRQEDEAIREPMRNVIRESIKEESSKDTNTGKKAMEKAFVDACVEEDYEQTRYCECTFDYLIDNFGENELMKMSVEMITDGGMSDKTADAFVDAAMACLDKYVY